MKAMHLKILTLGFITFSTFSVNGFSQDLRLILPVGHTSTVFNTAFSPDMKRIVTYSDKIAKIWDFHNQILLADLVGHEERILSVSMSSNGKFIATTSFDNTARLWSAETGRILKVLKGHTETVYSGSFSPDCKLLVTSSADSTARIWDLQSLKVRYILSGHKSSINQATFSPDGNLVLTASWDNSARIWNAHTGKLIVQLNGHVENVSSAIFSPDGSKVLTTSYDYTARLWDVKTGRLIKLLEGHEMNVMEGKFSPDGSKIITRAYDESYFFVEEDSAKHKQVLVWDAKTGKIIANLVGHHHQVTMASFSPDGRRIITSSEDRTAKIWNAANGQLLVNLNINGGPLGYADYSPDGQYILIADNAVHIYKEINKEYAGKLDGEAFRLNRVRFSNDGKKYLSESDDYLPRLWDTETGSLVRSFIGSIAFYSYDGTIVGTLLDSSILFWDAKNGDFIRETPVRVLDSHVKLSPDNSKIAVGSLGGCWIYDAIQGSLITTLEMPGEEITSVAFSPDGKQLLASGQGSTIYIWNPLSGVLLKELKNTAVKAWVSSFSPDGTKIISSFLDENFSAESEIKIWDANTFKELMTLRGYQNTFFSGDTEHIVSASIDHNRGRIWNAANYKLEREIKVDELSKITDVNFANKQVLAVNDYEIELYDLITGRKISTTLPFDEDDFIIRVPTKHYRSTRNAAKRLHYVTPDLRIVTMEQQDITYNRPDIVLQAIGNKDSTLINSYKRAYEKRIKKLQINTAQLTDKISVPHGEILKSVALSGSSDGFSEIHFEAHDSVFTLDRLNVWVNEVPIYGLKGIALGQSRKSIDTILQVQLSRGKNRIEMSVVNEIGIESYRSPIYFTYEPKNIKQESVYFVGIGIDNFAQKGFELNWSVKDIKDLASELKRKFGKNILIDTLYDQNVSVSNILDIKDRLSKLSVDDKVIICYSGHGLLDEKFDYYLSTYDVDFQNPSSTGLPYDVLEFLVDSIPPRKKLIMIDACHSGEVDKEAADQYEWFEKTNKDSTIRSSRKPLPKDGKVGMANSFELMQEIFLNVGKTTGATIISAAGGTQFALEKGELMNGVFTYSILEFMKGSKTATVSELKQYINTRVPELTSGLQIPTSRSESIAIDWTIW